MTEAEQIADLSKNVGKLIGTVETEGKHTRDSISKLFDMSNENKDKLITLRTEFDGHLHNDGKTVVREKDGLPDWKTIQKKVIAGAIVVGSITLGLGVAGLLISRLVGG